ncbi:ATP-dependent 5' to 3' DNA/RNA helicase Sen1 [Schizosaccharomyces cryophilus OY26]|uniref:ATP-dependent 5' to 3' DNA/RNA helicase Sen1 n=1 Tax=Schizosaccharomyces cryophilus (strain OY26 / ATCC MYA-4695 / CBS 11777 / NBRC 106824 / NRRL Y48691) TaxID=653667 RepID=S9X4Z8_SCHCR|nr:ATP-dependent 5' to 3' DNA/RNA helicase Sen1 [Schizosaccharomyces cryophilus OY26]EPY52157.1 ATP-dependent 5' to 3' DNA/RNA helicase Sen1 [Schizosaccharomyces cryophilus OY26]
MAEVDDQTCFEKLVLYKNAQHWFCSGLLDQYLRPIFLWMAKQPSPCFEWVLKCYNERLCSCTSCIQSFYHLRDESLAKFSYHYSGVSLANLERQWDEWMLNCTLSNFKKVEETILDFTVLPSLVYNVFLNPRLLKDHEAYTQALSGFVDLVSDWSSDTFLPGFLVIFFEESHSQIHEYIIDFLKTTENFHVTPEVFDNIFSLILYQRTNEDKSSLLSPCSAEFWKRASALFQLLPLNCVTALCESHFRDFFISQLEHEAFSDEKFACLRVFSNSPSFWLASDIFDQLENYLKKLLTNVTIVENVNASVCGWAYVLASLFRFCLNDFVLVFPSWLETFVQDKKVVDFIIYASFYALFDLLSLDNSSPHSLNEVLSMIDKKNISFFSEESDYLQKLKFRSLLYDILFVSWAHKALTRDPSFIFDPTYKVSPFWNSDVVKDVNFTNRFFEGLSTCYFVHDIELSESTTPEKSVVLFSEIWQTISSHISSFLRSFSQKDPSEVANYMQNDFIFDTLLGFLLSPSQQLYVDTFRIFQVFFGNVKNKNEVMKKLIENHFRGIVHGLVDATLHWQSAFTFFPALRIMRFVSTVNKLFSTDNEVWRENDLSSLGAYWQCVWNILDLVHSNVARWSLCNSNDTVKASMKLALKLITDLFQNDGLFIKFLAKFDGLVLLGETSDALFSLTTWLKINDLELREQVIGSLCMLFVKYSNFDYLFEDRTINFLTEFIIRKQKAHLSADQCKRLAEVIAQASPEAKNILDQNRLAEARKSKKQTELVSGTQFNKKPEPQMREKIQNVSVPADKKAPTPRMKMLDQLRQEYIARRAGHFAARDAAVSSRKATFENQKPPTNLLTEEDSDNEEVDESDRKEGLFSLAKANKVPEIRQTERRQIQLLSTPRSQLHPSQARMLSNRSAANTKARLFPNMSDFYNEILSWDPNYDAASPILKYHKSEGKIADTFRNIEQYMDVLQPMIFMECWSQIQATKKNLKFSPVEGIMIQRTAVNNFVDIGISVAPKDLYGYPLFDTEIVSLAFSREEAFSMKGLCCFAKIEKLVRQENGTLVVVRTLPTLEMLNKLQGNIPLYFLKLTNLSTFTRQYAAIRGLPYYHLLDDIVQGKPCSQPIKHSSSEVKGAMSRYQVNEPQAKAILSSLDNSGFTLIQGPPGTGKTKTIIGIITALLVDLNRYHISRPGGQSSTEPKQQMLLCAPSNAAVDEVLLRLKRGFTLSNGEHYVPKVVRIGNPETINVAVRDTSLEYQTEKQLLEVNQGAVDLGSLQELTRWRDVFYNCIQKIEDLEKQIDVARDMEEDTKALGRDLQNSINEKNLAEQKIEEFQSQSFTKNKEVDHLRKKAQKAILKQADVVCATLSGSGHDLVGHSFLNFSTVIIDEAAQAVELDTIIPLRYGAKKCILVGDPNQLPPTVLNQKAASYNYSQSLFVRIQKNYTDQMCLLSIQYRMHPHISYFPSMKFYESRLKDGEGMAEKTKQVWHSNSQFSQYRLFDVRGQERISTTSSSYNMEEVGYVVQMYEKLVGCFSDVNFTGRIGVITPYRQQLHELRKAFKDKFGKTIMSSVDIQTVDGFQGQEKDIIIFSCVKSYSKYSIGFLRDFRRLNVALTRARSSLFIVGNLETLKTDNLWGSLVDDALQRKLVESPHLGTDGQLIPVKNASEKRSKPTDFEESSGKKQAISDGIF